MMVLACCAFAPAASAQDPAPVPAPVPEPVPAPAPPATGGAHYGVQEPDPQPAVPAQPTVPGAVAQIVDGVAHAPADAPPAVQQAIWAGNRIVGMPYKYGGGHRRGLVDSGYDCSGTVSFALSGAALLRSPRDSSSFARYGQAGAGAWITIYTNPGHAYLHIAGIRLDTSAAEDRSGLKGPRWRPLRTNNRGFRARHPVGL